MSARARIHQRGPARRLSPEQIAVAKDLKVTDFAWYFGLSVSTVRGYVRLGLPVNRYPGMFTIPRVEGEQWLARFRSTARTVQIVDDVLAGVSR